MTLLGTVTQYQVGNSVGVRAITRPGTVRDQKQTYEITVPNPRLQQTQ